MKPDVASNDKRACPPCTGGCNQGRACPVVPQRDTEEPAREIFTAIITFLGLACALLVGYLVGTLEGWWR